MFMVVIVFHYKLMISDMIINLNFYMKIEKYNGINIMSGYEM